MTPISPRQQDTLVAIDAHIRRWGYPPTVKELCAATGIKSTNGVAEHLRRLEQKGYITRVPELARTTKLTNRALELLATLETKL